ncbi:hypothetical protein GJ496_001280 [Pomphorhynchus laevis]|nr:hypothetical protein GJ496_001280 [Pomphorhynchus laevis]
MDGPKGVYEKSNHFGPFGDFDSTRNFNEIGKCAPFHRQWLICSSLVGKHRSRKLCKDEYDDLMECKTHSKAYKRCMFIKEYRQRNKLGFMEAPPVDSFQYHEFKRN